MSQHPDSSKKYSFMSRGKPMESSNIWDMSPRGKVMSACFQRYQNRTLHFCLLGPSIPLRTEVNPLILEHHECGLL